MFVLWLFISMFYPQCAENIVGAKCVDITFNSEQDC